MLTDIRLTAVELDMLTRAANHVGAELVPAYPGEFRPADQHCLGLRATPGQLFRFGGVLTLVLDISRELLGQLAARVCEDTAVPGAAERVYYWPGDHVMTEESLAWLGCALWLTDGGATPAEAARGADVVLAALREVDAASLP